MAKDISTELSVSEDSVQMALFRYSRSGLVSRTEKAGGYRKPSFLYAITAKGLGRLAYLEKTNSLREHTPH